MKHNIDRPLVGPDSTEEAMAQLSTIRRIKPDRAAIELTQKVLEQNAAILKMNARVIDMLTAYVVTVKR